MMQDKIDIELSEKFWEDRAIQASDPRAVTLDNMNPKLVNLQIKCFQNWFIHHAKKVGCQWDDVVDLGCGNGDWAFRLAEYAKNQLGVDFSQGFVDHCNKRADAANCSANMKFVQHNVATFEFPTTCDLVVCGGVVQCLDDEEVLRVFSNIHDHLHSGGLLYLRTSVSRTGEQIVNCDEDYQAIYRLSDRYEELLLRSGFRVERRVKSTSLMSQELARMVVGSALLPSLGWALRVPISLLWTIHRRLFKQTDNYSCIAAKA